MSNWPERPPEPSPGSAAVPPPPLPIGRATAPPLPTFGGIPPMGWESEVVRFQPGTVDSQGRVARDESCRNCGYNLRGLSAEGRCPECGRAVGLSILGDLLRYSDPDWLAKLRRGAKLILIGVLGGIVAGIVVAALRASGPAAASAQAGSPATILTLAAQALVLVGTWMLTEPDPSGVGESQYGTSRNLIRVMLLIGIVQPLVNAAIPALRPSLDATRLLALVTVPLGLAKVVGEFALLHYLGKLARRIPDPPLAARANFLKWALGVSYTVVVIFGVIIAAVVFSSGPRLAVMLPLAGVAGLAGLAVFVFGVMYLFMLNRFADAFKQQEEIGRHTWAATAEPQRVA